MTIKRVDYNQVASVYDQRYQAGGPPGVAECLRHLACKVKARRVLEVGCGTGRWLTLLHDIETRCGLDYSAGMLNKARQRDEALNLTRATATQLPYERHSFDFIFCIHALHHFDDPPTFIGEAYRLVRSGGALAIIGMDPRTEQDRWYLYDCFPGTYETDLERYPSGAVILRWMKAVGFVKCERYLASRIEHDYIGKEVLKDPVLQKNGTSQLSILTEVAFMDGMQRIKQAIQQAKDHGKEIVFSTRIALPVTVGYVPV